MGRTRWATGTDIGSTDGRKVLSPVRRVRDALNALARRRAYLVVLTGLASLVLSAMLTARDGVREPQVHDELSYLLAADTFAHGRLTNPTPRGHEHFETFHVIVEPTYQSKYPPGQGMFLALGWRLTGMWVAGAWIGVAVGCAATAWMLMAFVPARWAMLGAAITVLHPMVLRWGQNYWGGGVAMAAGALAIGATGRLCRAPGPWNGRPIHWSLLGVGIIGLGNTRPFEGGLLTIVLITVLVRAMWQRQATARQAVAVRWRTLGLRSLPLWGVLMAGAAFMAYYNYRVTGDPLRLPYVEHDAQYAVTTPFLWLEPHPEPTYRHAAIREWAVGYQYDLYLRQQTLAGFLTEARAKAVELLRLIIPPVMLPLAIVIGLIPGRRWRRGRVLAAVACAVVGVGLLSEIVVWPHYAAPVLPLFVLLGVLGVGRTSTWLERRLGRRGLAAWAPAVLVVAVLATSCGTAINVVTSDAWRYRDGPAYRRAEMVAALEAEPGDDLVFVRYGASRNLDNEWVYNAADLGAAPVIWARDMSAARNAQLMEWYPGRRAWIVDIDAASVRIEEVFR